MRVGKDAMEQPEHNSPPPSRWAGLKERVLSAMVLVSLVLSTLLIGNLPFTLLVIVAALQMLREWDGLTKQEGIIWRLAGLAYVALPCASILWLRMQPEGLYMVLFVLFAVWSTDIGAYFTGRKIGGAKLWAAISPKKTWAGLAGGMVSAALVAGIMSSFTPYPATLPEAVIIGMAIAIVGQAGDFFESWLKRRAGVKDSGKLIPGHGGILDRVDGLIFTLPLFALLAYLFGTLS